MPGAEFEVPYPLIAFVDDDAGYLGWYRDNYKGYVLNAERRPSAKYLMVHLLPCDHLEGNLPWTSTDKCKICSPTKDDIDGWTMSEFGRHPDRCSSCQP